MKKLVVLAALSLLVSVFFVFCTFAQTDTPQIDLDARLARMGFEVPTPSSSVGIYKSVVIVGNMAYLAGHVPRTATGEILSGNMANSPLFALSEVIQNRYWAGSYSRIWCYFPPAPV